MNIRLRSQLYDRCVRRRLVPAGPGRVRLHGAPPPLHAAPLVAAALGRAAGRADLAVALLAGHTDDARPLTAWALDRVLTADSAAPGAGAVIERVLTDWHRRVTPADDTMLALAVATKEAAALGALAARVGADSPEAGRDLPDRLAKLAVEASPPDVLLAAWAGEPSSVSRLQDELPASVLSPYGAVGEHGEIDPLLTLAAVECAPDLAVRVALAAGFCAAVERSAACGVLSPSGLTHGGEPAGTAESEITAAVALLLGHDQLAWPPVDPTPSHRGTADDERRFLAEARELPRGSEVAPGVTVADLLAAHRRPAPAPDVVYEAGIGYVDRGDQTLRLHLHRPMVPAVGGTATVLFIHGGGWETGNPAKYLRVAAEWAASGWVTACPAYRLVPAAQFPAPYDDITAALAWVRDSAPALGADPQQVVLVGDSAGAHLALLAAARPPDGVKIRGVVALSPLTDPESTALPPDGRRLLQRLLGDDRSAWSTASPQRCITPSMPPVLSFVGSLDTLTTPVMVRRYHSALDAAGVPNRMVELAGRYHAFEFAPSDAALWTSTAQEWIADLLGGQA